MVDNKADAPIKQRNSDLQQSVAQISQANDELRRIIEGLKQSVAELHSQQAAAAAGLADAEEMSHAQDDTERQLQRQAEELEKNIVKLKQEIDDEKLAKKNKFKIDDF